MVHKRNGSRPGALGFGALALCAGLLAACGSSPASGQASSPAAKATCQDVAAVLSDGPDPGADPVGYAQAQILPLRQIHPSDKVLHSAIDNLASAYQQFSSTNGNKAAKQAVSKASKTINTLCPGTGAGV